MNIASFMMALLSLSASPLFTKWSQAPVEFLGFWRFLIAGSLLLAWVFFRTKDFNQQRRWQDWTWPLIAGCFFFVHQWTYMLAAKNTSIAHMLILFETNPLFTVAGAALFFHEKLKKRLLMVYPLAFAGLLLLVREKVSAVPDSTFGDGMALLSAAFHAAYLLCSKRARQTFDNLRFSSVLYLTAALLFLGLGWVRPGENLQVHTSQGWIAVAGLILFPTFLGHLQITNLMNQMEVSLLSCGKLLEPGLSSIMAYFLFRESISEITMIAFVMMSLAVLIMLWPQAWHLQRRS